MGRRIIMCCLLTLAAGAAQARPVPDRPAPGEKPDFHVSVGAGWLAFDGAGIDARRWGLVAGVGWTWAERLRLEAEIGGWTLEDDITFGRGCALVLVPLAGGLSALGSVAAVGATFPGDEDLGGFEAGVGAAYVWHVGGPISLEGRYTYVIQRFFEAEIGGETIHPDARGHLLGVHLIIDL